MDMLQRTYYSITQGSWNRHPWNYRVPFQIVGSWGGVSFITRSY